MRLVIRGFVALGVVLFLSACSLLAAKVDEDGEPQRVNVALNKKVESSTYRDPYPPQLAVDGEWGTKDSRWLPKASSDIPHWLAIDLGGTFVLDGAEVWTGDPTANNPSYVTIRNYKLEYWDGNDWVDIPGASVENNEEEQVVFTFEDPIVTNKVRFYSEDEDVIRVREVMVFGIPYVD